MLLEVSVAAGEVAGVGGSGVGVGAVRVVVGTTDGSVDSKDGVFSLQLDSKYSEIINSSQLIHFNAKQIIRNHKENHSAGNP
ncbi:Hypothetical predicted protein [Octopus vulgaris]|uniref:Uncharacterized protein n=1 Tax=Octopus vulgaris TaxID=6645 RepID=A0AA36F1X1_OCTVU|nr:Hypothetical predicted protein [Octopus vulgaris]